MNSHNEDKKYLYFGKTEIDVSNIPYGKKVKAQDIWNDSIMSDLKLTKKQQKRIDSFDSETLKDSYRAIYKTKYIEKMIKRLGLYLMRQPLKVLRRRYTTVDAIREYIKRLLLTMKIYSMSTEAQVKEFEDWISIQMTGKKKELIQIEKTVSEITNNMIKELMKKTNKSLEECLQLLQTSAEEWTKQLIASTQDHKKS